MWDMPVNTDRTITANRPDIIVKDSVNSTCKLIDMTVPSDRSIALKEIEKKSKYKDLELDIQSVAYENNIIVIVIIIIIIIIVIYIYKIILFISHNQ